MFLNQLNCKSKMFFAHNHHFEGFEKYLFQGLWALNHVQDVIIFSLSNKLVEYMLLVTTADESRY